MPDQAPLTPEERAEKKRLKFFARLRSNPGPFSKKDARRLLAYYDTLELRHKTLLAKCEEK